MGVAARRMSQGADRLHHRPGGRDRGEFQRLLPGMGRVASGMGWRDQVVAVANKRPFVTCLIVFALSAAIIAEAVFLIWGYSTPPKECLTALLRAIGGS